LRGNARRVLGELRLPGHQPAALGLDHDQAVTKADLQVRPPAGVTFLQPQYRALAVGARGNALHDAVKQTRAVREREPERSRQVILVPPQQVEHARDFPAVPRQQRVRGHDVSISS
jgi:hypothetical protein